MLNWIKEDYSGSLGALSESENLQAKAILQIWLKNNPGFAPQLTGLNYGSQSEDHVPDWGNRDGWALSAFSAWWDATGRSPVLDVGTVDLSKGTYLWVDLSNAHADAVNTWAVENGFLPSNWGGPTPATQPTLPFPGLPSLPGLPAIPSIPPNGWPGAWPPVPPPWWPPSLTGIYPPIGDWGQGALQKPPGWDLTGLPWPPPTPGTQGFPGTWPTVPGGQYPFPIPKSAFVQGGLPPPPEPIPTGPLPPPPAPKPAPSAARSSSNTTAILFGVGLVALIAIVVATSAVGGLPAGRDEQ